MIGETVTVLRETAAAGFGERPAFADHHDVPGCLFAPTGGFELTSGRDTVTTQPTLYMPPAPDIRSTDRVRVRGVVFQVDGEPAVWRMGDWDAGVQVPLKGTAG